MNSESTFKELVHRHCTQLLVSKLGDLQANLDSLAESVANETKSTAGDKYETARAMLHIEQDQVRRQIQEFKSQLAVLNSIDPSKSSEKVALGSFVQIDNNYYFLSTGLGKITVDGKLVIVLSPQAPLGAKLLGRVAGDEVVMNGRKMVVGEVL